jgi:hypothetical protein
MSVRLAFDRLVHSDWSVLPRKRWTATAVHSPQGWLITCLEQTPPSERFLDYLFNCPSHTLAGFDFPIGLPSYYSTKTGLNLRDLISDPSSELAKRFLTPAETLFDISLRQPFYRKHPKGGRHRDLFRVIECESICDLLRECDKKTRNRLRAESVFWTVGAKQVGKAALTGWREMLIPALARGAGLWPFDGSLSSLASNRLTIAETYPAEAYRHIGMAKIIKKRSQSGRNAAGATMIEWAAKQNVSFAESIKEKILSGFGAGDEGEDPFDAVAGLCGMIEVADGRRAEGPCMESVKRGEGWILGQIDLPI